MFRSFRQGFSQSAWLLIPRFDSPVKKQPDPPQFLSLASEELTAEFAEFIQTNRLPEELVSGKRAPLIDTPHLVAPGLVSGTTVTLEGPLQSDVLSLAGLPQRTDLLLTNTVVQVLVNAAGMTVSAALLSSCKVPEADTAALAFARTARFAPLRSSALTNHATTASLTFGNLVFQWCSFRWEPPTTVGAGF
ncbi:MAG: energy transducer TonB [Verrucomicrobiota bacterium]